MLDTIPPGMFMYCDKDRDFYLVLGTIAELTTVINFSRSFKRYSVTDYRTNYYRWFFSINCRILSQTVQRFSRL